MLRGELAVGVPVVVEIDDVWVCSLEGVQETSGQLYTLSGCTVWPTNVPTDLVHQCGLTWSQVRNESV
jgi:hypothetical protein